MEDHKAEIDGHKEELLRNQKDGKGEWKGELSSNSEAAVCFSPICFSFFLSSFFSSFFSIISFNRLVFLVLSKKKPSLRDQKLEWGEGEGG